MSGQTAREFTAQMSLREGRWRLYVVLLNTTDAWPEYRFGRAVPTFTDRTDALSVLGFEPVPGAEWAWTEDSETPDDPASAVVLIAAIRVRSWSGVGV
ncbi:DUF6303 family protein [Streptomyces phaeochromogenes]|uniref:DUF6303 family protein n=1 Tax=Streptomyces phaeochromogenes TaxID=1923 RepID=UPI00386D8A7B|nr:DUF6303 family protein [Streptomyces phaeochromogenes]